MVAFDMELTQKQAETYRTASKQHKQQLITQHCELTGISRNAAVQRFKRAVTHKQGFVPTKPLGPRGAPKVYRDEHRRLVLSLSDISGGVAAERLQPMLGVYLVQLARAKQLDAYRPEVIAAVRGLPVISLKRILKDLGITRKKRRLPAQNDIAKQIPIVAHFGPFADRLGYVGLDYVEHNGGDSSGRFVISGCYVDIATQWLARGAGWGKNLASTETIHATALTRIYHHLRHFHTDNAPAAMRMLFDRLSEPQVKYDLSRSRAYHKNDNAHVEQKNGDKIRKLIGFWRLDCQAACNILNELYAVEDTITNYFIASAKLIGKDYDTKGKLIRKRYDTPKTPYQRLLEHPKTSNKTKRQVVVIRQNLDLVALRRRSDELLQQLAAYHGKLR